MTEITKALRWFAKVTTHCEHNIVSCPECEFHGFCTDPYSDDGICKMHECLTAAASLIESLQAQLHNFEVHADCMEAKAIAFEAALKESQRREQAAVEDLYIACKRSPCNTGVCTTKGCKGNRIPCEFEWRGVKEERE